MIKILITGPESSGKSHLVKSLASHFNGAYVKEYVREYMGESTEYTQADLMKIAQGQVDSENQVERKNVKMLFCDTGPEVIKIWSQVKYGNVVPELEVLYNKHTYDFILLCKPNIPWVADPLRENPDNREELFQLYHELIDGSKTSYIVINAELNQRVNQGVNAVNDFLSQIEK